MANVLEAAARANFTPAPVEMDDDYWKKNIERFRKESDGISVRSDSTVADRFLEDHIRQILKNDEAILTRSPHMFESLFVRHGADGVVTVNCLYRNLRHHLRGFILAARELGMMHFDLVEGGGPGWKEPVVHPNAAPDRFLAINEAVRDELVDLGIAPSLVDILPGIHPGAAGNARVNS
ncbi:MAG: hypothetical protein AAB229_03320 [Candidatus Hydrogenedentota bacterium]